MTKAELREFMKVPTLGVLGTISPEGAPQSALVGIAVTEELEIIFDTVNSSRKYRNLMGNPAASFVVGWSGEITVQYQGMASEPAGAELARYKDIYFAKWPDCRVHQQWSGIAYFVVRPTWARYSDFNQAPAFIEEFTF